GVSLPIEKIRRGVPLAFKALAADQGPQAARAIMTTDPFPKESATQISVGGLPVGIGGMAKGSGMIEPMMATMLGFVTTDAAVAPRRRTPARRRKRLRTRRSSRRRFTAAVRTGAA